jgi:hypothetical protein
MNTIHDHDEPIDPRLKDLLDRLRPIPPRDPKAAAQRKARFMAELDELFTIQPHPSRQLLTGWQSIFHTLKERFTMLKLAQRTVLITLIVIGVFLIGGFSMTAAAQSALPGDALYPVKTGMEQVQLSMKTDSGAQAELYVEFAGRRLAEIEKLVDAGRYEEVSAVAAEFQVSVQKALQAVQALAATNPTRATELAGILANRLVSYTQTLTRMIGSVPTPIQPSLQSAANSAQSALDNQNDNDDGNVNDNDNGNDNDDGNVNDNDDGNVNDNDDGNVNDNDDGNVNDNDDGNVNDNDDGNVNDNNNGNVNDNDNGNVNDNDDGNVNDNDDGNVNDNNNGNVNDNDNGNVNDNDNGGNNGYIPPASTLVFSGLVLNIDTIMI